MKKSTITFFNFSLLFSFIIGINLNTDSYLNQYFNQDYLEKRAGFEYNQFAGLEGEDSITKFNQLGVELHPGSEYLPGSNGNPRSLNHCKSLVYKSLKSLPDEPVQHLEHLTLYFSDSGRRGLGGGNTVILRCQNVTDEELVAVLVHEMGHVMDTGVMDGNYEAGASAYNDGDNRVYLDDKSIEFYNISWLREDKMKKNAEKMDFVSGYAMTDPFEDFAESYAYYILHGTEFKKLALYNDVLKQKYNYLKNEVFDGKEFQNGTQQIARMNVNLRNYDVTVLPYSLDKFFII